VAATFLLLFPKDNNNNKKIFVNKNEKVDKKKHSVMRTHTAQREKKKKKKKNVGQKERFEQVKFLLLILFINVLYPATLSTKTTSCRRVANASQDGRRPCGRH
jgi:hypothetical protein